MPRVKAMVWDYFNISNESDKFASCAVCKDRVSRGGSCVKSFNMTNLIDHLKKKHPGDNADYEEKKKTRELKKKRREKNKQLFASLQ